MRNTASLIALSALVAAACGGGSKGGDTTPIGDQPPAIQPLDIAHTYEPAEALEGMVFIPEALERPGMPPVTKKRMPTLAAQRKAVAKAKSKPAAKRKDDVHVLVTLLWAEGQAKEASDASAAMALYTEGRDALRDLKAGFGETPDELTWHRLAIAEMTTGDEAAAANTWAQAVAAFPDSDKANEYKTWLAYVYLRQGKSADAAQLVEGWDPVAAETSAEAAYVVAWTRMRGGDWAGARAAIAAAAAKWQGDAGRAPLERDLLLFVSRSGTSAEEAAKIIGDYAGKSAMKRAQLLFNLASQGYLFAGYFGQAASTLDLMLDGAIPSDVVTFRYLQSDFEYRQQNPLVAAERASQSWQTLQQCGDKCPEQMKEPVVQRIHDLAVNFHTVYARTLDDRYEKAATVLYELYLSIPGPNAEQVQTHKKNLEDTKKTADPSAGKHEKEVMKSAVLARREAIIACYENVLSGSPDLAGDLTITIEINEQGEVTGANTEPAAGKEGLAAVGACIQDRVKGWAFPRRTVPGKTVLVYPVKLSPKADG